MGNYLGLWFLAWVLSCVCKPEHAPPCSCKWWDCANGKAFLQRVFVSYSIASTWGDKVYLVESRAIHSMCQRRAEPWGRSEVSGTDVLCAGLERLILTYEDPTWQSISSTFSSFFPVYSFIYTWELYSFLRHCTRSHHRLVSWRLPQSDRGRIKYVWAVFCPLLSQMLWRSVQVQKQWIVF